MDYYRGKVVFVTGASSGMGLAMLKILSTVPRCKLVASSRAATKLEKLVQTFASDPATIKCISLDLEDSDAGINAATVAAWRIHGRIDVLVNCAGMGFRGKVLETDMKVDRRIMQVDYFGQVAVIKGILSLAHSAPADCRCHIIQVGSVQGFIGLGERAPYSAAKHALVGFIDSLRVEVSGYPASGEVTVSLVSPGYIATNHSVNSITGDGSAYNQQDESTSGGFTAEYVAHVALLRAARLDNEIIISDTKIRVLIWIRALFSNLCFRILRNRFIGKRESILASISKWIVGSE